MSKDLYNIKFKLPSEGVWYPEGSPLKEEIELRMMTVADEKKLFGAFTEESINNLIKDCVTNIELDPDDLIESDKEYVLNQLRILTYGSTYLNTSKCPHCGHKCSHKIDLSERPLIIHEDELTNPYIITLPVSKKKVGLRELNGKQKKLIDRRAKELERTAGISQGETRYIASLASRVIQVDGVESKFKQSETFLMDLTPKDVAFISNSIKKIQTGYTGVVDVRCTNPGCTEDYEAPVFMSTEFFRPTTFD